MAGINQNDWNKALEKLRKSAGNQSTRQIVDRMKSSVPPEAQQRIQDKLNQIGAVLDQQSAQFHQSGQQAQKTTFNAFRGGTRRQNAQKKYTYGTDAPKYQFSQQNDLNRNPVKELTDLAECHNHHNCEMDLFGYGSGSRMNFGSESIKEERKEKARSANTRKPQRAKIGVGKALFIVIIMAIVGLVVGFLGEMVERGQEITWDNVVHTVEQEIGLSNPKKPSTGHSGINTSAGIAGAYQADEDADYYMSEDDIQSSEEATGASEDELFNFFVLCSKTGIHAVNNMKRAPELDENGAEAYSFQTELLSDAPIDCMVWLNGTAPMKLNFVDYVLFDGGEIQQTVGDVAFDHDDLSIIDEQGSCVDGHADISFSIANTGGRHYQAVYVIIFYYSGDSLVAYDDREFTGDFGPDQVVHFSFIDDEIGGADRYEISDYYAY